MRSIPLRNYSRKKKAGWVCIENYLAISIDGVRTLLNPSPLFISQNVYCTFKQTRKRKKSVIEEEREKGERQIETKKVIERHIHTHTHTHKKELFERKKKRAVS